MFFLLKSSIFYENLKLQLRNISPTLMILRELKYFVIRESHTCDIKIMKIFCYSCIVHVKV
jgi:hypothetical protein